VGETGRTVGAINVVPSYPVRAVNGFMVACMLAPPGAQDIIYPPEYRPLLGDDYLISLEPPKQLVATAPDYRVQALDYLARLRRLGQRRLEVTLRLMRERPCDLLAVIFYEPDRVQHFFWKHLIGERPDGADPAVVEELAAAARAIYRDLDGAIGTLVRESGPDTVTFIVSDHGFAGSPDRFVYVNRWLADRGFLHVHRTWKLRRSVLKRLPSRLRKRYDTLEHVFVNWRRTQAWCDAMETRSAGVWLNVAGRQPHGHVEPGPIEAIAPTILCLLGLPVPDGMDAAPMLEFLTPQARAATPLTYVPDVAPTAAAGDEGYASEEDREQVEARLRALGYVE